MIRSSLPEVHINVLCPKCKPPKKESDANALRRCEMALRMILKITGNALVRRLAKDALAGKDSDDGQ